ncbi:Detected protein of unknown function [Hibiscus syriacus]|uniref:Uncharacterized protein n=1 Tax=Hibiscus syriacus TaxID=106335 RepID=A0A6A2WRI6_HIBSY|nr:Detected protein of unknown function [Hibiscus syriacus]
MLCVLSSWDRRSGLSLLLLQLINMMGISRLVSEPDMKKNQQANVDKKPRAAAPRFAPELDGLHCFETLVSH